MKEAANYVHGIGDVHSSRHSGRKEKPKRMRRSSIAMPTIGEPLIVVEESTCLEEEPGLSQPGTSREDIYHRGYSLDRDSPPNPYLLSPWRDTRKHSLPTPACTSGPTASQVRRLSERGEGTGKQARETAFLATLSQAPPQPGGRRHSVVTISKVPQALFGRGRRESIATFPGLSRRRDSTKYPPATDGLGSTHNLQLDIMDDIVNARKVRMKLWNTSKERVCEVQPLDENASSSVRYTRASRRHSDFVGTIPPSISNRRFSEMPSPTPPQKGLPRAKIGIVCSDDDLQSLLNALTSSATEINRCGEIKPEPRLRKLGDARSSSFDASSLHNTQNSGGWYTKRHQTLAVKNEGKTKTKSVQFKKPSSEAEVVWDKPSGSVVDARALGSAIEVFLRKNGADDSGKSKKEEDDRWCRNKSDEENRNETCETSLCSTLKDLFVK